MNIPTKDVDIDNESIGIARTLGDVEQLLRDLGMPVKALMETLTESKAGFHMKRAPAASKHIAQAGIW